MKKNSVVGWAALVYIAALSACCFAAEVPQPYTGKISFDLTRVPFSRSASDLAFSHLKDGPMGDGLYLRSIHREVRHEVMRIDLVREGVVLQFREIATPTVLRLEANGGFAEICISEPNLLKVRGQGLSVRFSKVPDAAGFAFQRDATHWVFNSAQQDIGFMFIASKASLTAESDWDGGSARRVVMEFSPTESMQSFEGEVEEFRGSWHERMVTSDFAEAAASLDREYKDWLNHMAAVPSKFQSAAELAAYIDWSAVVMPQGNFGRPSMLMSKNWMDGIWSWDHCFNAMALIGARPTIAWDQYMLMFDKQNADGALPDQLSDRQITWAYSKPPVHGWALAWMMKHSQSIDEKKLAEAYEPLSRWTNWYFEFRDDDHDGLPQYDHGNDSGWDNSTVFRSSPDVETPDLASYLVIQMNTLSEMAHRLGRAQESQHWKRRADTLLQKLLATYWRSDHFVALHSGDHSVIESDSLLPYMPIILGNLLPQEVRLKLVAGLKQSGQFLTEHGLATEKMSSPYYDKDGYWRGPIWAPATFIVVDGLETIGEKDFARELKLRFCRMAASQGMAENYDAISGKALRDPAYTWSASVFLIFAHQLLDQ